MYPMHCDDLCNLVVLTCSTTIFKLLNHPVFIINPSLKNYETSALNTLCSTSSPFPTLFKYLFTQQAAFLCFPILIFSFLFEAQHFQNFIDFRKAHADVFSQLHRFDIHHRLNHSNQSIRIGCGN